MCRCWRLPSENTGCKKCFVSLEPKCPLSSCGIQNCKWQTLSKDKTGSGGKDANNVLLVLVVRESKEELDPIDSTLFSFVPPWMPALSLSLSLPCWSRSPFLPDRHLSCDMNINTPLGLMNTQLIKTYVAIDPRVRPFAMIIKHWARKRVLNDAGMEESYHFYSLHMFLYA